MQQFIRWGDPSAFNYLLLLIGLVLLYFYTERSFSKKLDEKFGAKVSKYLTQSLSLARRRLKFVLQIAGIVFVIVAMARPQAGESSQEIKSEGIELLILADVSESMNAEDVKPSRLAQLKIELSKLLELMPGNKIGILAFAGSASLLSPLTTDPNALRMYIDSLDSDSVSTQGTNFETALQYAKEAFDRGGVTQDAGSQTTRAILVVSDGEDQEKGALEVAQNLAQSGIRIFSIAYGTEKGGTILERDHFGNSTAYKKDSSGQVIISKVRGEFLSSLAEAGGGKFYFATFGGDHLKSFVQELGKLEKTQFSSSHMIQYSEKYTLPLFIGLSLLFLSFFLRDRKGEKGVWKGKYEN